MVAARLIFACLCVCLLSCCFSPDLSAGGFALKVNDVSGFDGSWPMTGGLPFPEGEIRDASRVRVVDGDGTEVPAQVDVAARYLDGSIRWAMARFSASPQGAYRLEYGPGVSRSAPDPALVVAVRPGGGIVVDTGPAVYEFAPDALLPETARLDGTEFLSGAGDGAYLVDNHGRLSRVAGEVAEVVSETLVGGPAQAVIRREGWYVTDEGVRVARARAWFYFSAGTPFLRITHSLVFTGDTNETWVRDYGLEFRAPSSPEKVTFAMRGEGGESTVETRPGSGEAYLLQDTFPHFFETESRAVVGGQEAQEVVPPWSRPAGDAAFWRDDWAAAGEVAGDWGEAVYAGHALAVVMPRLAERFPKEIAFGPRGARAVFWSGRTGRELDFRAATLVREYWQEWAQRAPGGAEELAAQPSNAQGASRTHDIWLLPRRLGTEEKQARAALRAASDPPLLQAEPGWICSSGALGWVLHPEDEDRFPEQERIISDSWKRVMDQREARAPYGFIEWGRHPAIRGMGSFFRLSRLVDYGLRRAAWGLYARSGERAYYDYATAFNRFAGDWEMADWDTNGKFRGGLADGTSINLPLYWGTRTNLIGYNITGDDIANWAFEYYMTGDAWAGDRIELTAEAFRRHFDPAEIPRLTARVDSVFTFIRRMVILHAWTEDDIFLSWAQLWLEHLVDLDNPTAITDDIRHGPHYKGDRDLLILYEYYRVTGDETARRAFLQGVDYKLRFNRVGLSYGGQDFSAMLCANAYRLTGDSDYLRALNYVVQGGVPRFGVANIGVHTFPFYQGQSLPAALSVLAGVDEPIDPWPVAVLHRDVVETSLLFRKAGGDEPVEFRFAIWMEEEFTEPGARLFAWAEGEAGAGVEGLRLEPELSFQPSGLRADPTHWHLRATVPADAPAGLYQLDFPGAQRIDVLNSTAAQTAVYAPDGFRTRGDATADYFSVPPGQEELRLILSGSMEVRCPDGLVIDDLRGQGGEKVVPVEGREGAWSVVALGPGNIILLNVEPLFSRSSDWLVTGAGADPAPRFEMPSEETAFVPGIDVLGWQSLHLPGRETVEFPRGRETESGYEFFPGSEGTVEFWFRPNWSSAELPTTGWRNDYFFLRAGSHDIQYRRGFLRSQEIANVNLWAHGRDSNTGFTGEFWFEAGQWYHLAAAWRIDDGKPGNEGYFTVFINGREFEPDGIRPGTASPSWSVWPGRSGGYEDFYRRPADETITLGPLNGTIAQLRISDTVRYESDFEPPARLGAPDADTLVQFDFDGDYRGETAGDAVVEAGPAKGDG